ncbi:sialate O-acetylesterase [uncultured Dokdonia sp.]|uniref:T9SS type A sorting domain-containing protein n=1 Tax=uncultured Dokdonia sp. TaxID=575653 RepID=UPI0026047551|nr:sialate O-acetylesterase [uncultured Dokdonia sp.]
MKKITFLLVVLLSYTAFSQITITNISSYQVFQRNGTGNADIPIEGTYSGTPESIEARWNSNDVWTTLSINDSETFSGTLVDQNQGQGTLEIRFSNDPLIESSIEYVGVGDIFIIAGQSNASGRGLTLNNYSHPSLKATLFGNDDVWKELSDASDSHIGQVDEVSIDYIAAGSVWPLIATDIMEVENIPVAFIPTAQGGTRVIQWQPGDDHFDPSTLYGSMSRRIQAIGGKIKGILFFQGESDAQMNTTQMDYEDLLNNYVNTVVSDFPGVSVIVGQIGQANFDDLDPIRAAQINVANSNINAHIGPATYDINLSDEEGDTLHYKSDNDIQEFARRWFMAINNTYYRGTNGYGPIVITDDVSYNLTENKITVPFSGNTSPVINEASTVTVNSFDLMNDNIAISISSISITNNSIEITPTSVLDVNQPITLSYASLNKGVDAAIYDIENLPAQNFYNLAVPLDEELSTSSFSKNNLSIYPNPVQESVFLSFDPSVNEEITLKLYASTGQLIITKTAHTNDHTLEIDTSILHSGIYYLHFLTEATQEVKKIIKY